MRTILYAGVAIILAGPAFAQNSPAQSTSTSSGHSNAVAIINTGGANGSGTAGDPSGAGGGDPTINYKGGYTLRNTPDIAVSSYAGAANACGVGGSIGVSGPGFGIGGSLAKESENCVKREWFKLMEITAEHIPAQANDYRQWAAGIACSVDTIKEVAPPGYCGRPPVAPPVASVQAPQVAAAPQEPRAPRPDWCTRAAPTTDASRAYVHSVCG